MGQLLFSSWCCFSFSCRLVYKRNSLSQPPLRKLLLVLPVNRQMGITLSISLIVSRMIKGNAMAFMTGRTFRLDDELFSLQRTFALHEVQIESVTSVFPEENNMIIDRVKYDYPPPL